MRIWSTFNPAAPGDIGGTTPGAITGTTITATQKFLAADGTSGAPAIAFSSDTGLGFYRPSTSMIAVRSNSAGRQAIVSFSAAVGMVLPADMAFSFASGGAPTSMGDVVLRRQAANILAQHNGAAAQEYQLYGTRTDASNYERLVARTVAGSKATIAVETAGTGADNLDLELVPAGTGVLQISNPQNGAAAATGTLTNAPSAGNPSEWLKVKIGANVRYIPCWA